MFACLGGGAERPCEDEMRAVFQDTDQLSSPGRDEQNRHKASWLEGVLVMVIFQ